LLAAPALAAPFLPACLPIASVFFLSRCSEIRCFDLTRYLSIWIFVFFVFVDRFLSFFSTYVFATQSAFLGCFWEAKLPPVSWNPGSLVIMRLPCRMIVLPCKELFLVSSYTTIHPVSVAAKFTPRLSNLLALLIVISEESPDLGCKFSQKPRI
jgi:hypothetical protein